jgi:hypothetical protein
MFFGMLHISLVLRIANIGYYSEWKHILFAFFLFVVKCIHQEMFEMKVIDPNEACDNLKNDELLSENLF